MGGLRSAAAALAWVAASAACVAPASAQPARPASGPEIRVADNVIVVPDANARSITGWLIVKAGCADEAGGNCAGIAHYLEHLLFINRDNDHRSKVAFFADGSGNGWTSHRATTYFQRFPAKPETNAERLDKLLAYFAGLLTDVRVEGPQGERERNVVMQEYQQRTGRNPFARFAVRLNRALMPDEPLGQSVIGAPETIATFTPEAARAFHERWYARGNAVIVLHGPIDPAAVKALAASRLGGLPVRKVPANAWKAPRTYAAEQLVLRTRDKEARQIGVSLDKIVVQRAAAGDSGRATGAQAVLSAFLGSRLAGSPLDVLIDKQGVIMQGRLGVSRVREGAWRLSFSGVPAEGVAPDKVIEAARAYIATLARTGLDRATVERLKLRLRNERNLLAEQPGVYAQALVGWLGAHYSHASWRSRAADNEAVTAASVNRLIAILAGPGREVAGVIEPEAGQPSRPAGASSASPPLDTNPGSALPQGHL